MTDFPKKSLDDWAALAQKECRDKPLDDLTIDTPEGIPVKPLYTAADLEGLDHVGSMPGTAPFVRGPRATMYARASLDRAPVRRFLDRRGIQRLLPPEPRSRADRTLGRL